MASREDFMLRRFAWLCVTLSLVLSAADYDRYGGWNKIKGRKTGFFHAQNIKSRWWLVTPEGNAFFSKGVCHVAFDPENASAPAAPADRAAWSRRTAGELRGWGFNTAGAWSYPEFSGADFVFTPIVNIAASAQRDLWLKGTVPDYFGPAFAEAADRAAKRICAPLAQNPWLLGYFTDNELRWGPDWRSKESLLESYLKFDPASPGRQRAEALLRERGRAAGQIADDDKAAFVEIAAGEYARVSREAILRHDPHHMVIGCRFAGYAPEPVLRGVARSFDVISYNTYSPSAPAEQMNQIASITGKPTMVTEFSFKAMDSGLPNTKGAAKPVATQQERADGFTRFVEALAAMPHCVGFHWFQYRDQPKEGRRLDGENSNYGVVKLDGSPWEILAARMKEVNARIDKLAAGAR
jgi:hypothetical protein